MHKRTRHQLLLAMTGLLVPLLPAGAIAQDERDPLAQRDSPSRELLEFLVEYGDTDEDSFELIVFHAKRDSKAGNEQEQPRVDTAEPLPTTPQLLQQEPAHAY